ncbi:MAG: hypothetical protein IKS07_10885 [Lachnospiraceae bacterium]|nr:hypothetical protein [Lachnospiraceae bacterium]
MNRKVSKWLLLAACILLLAGCGQKQEPVQEAAQEAAPEKEPVVSESEPVADLVDQPETDPAMEAAPEADDAQPEPAQPETGRSETLTQRYTGPYSSMVVVCINPEFHFYLGAQDEILAIDPVNEDAQQVLSAMEESGITYEGLTLTEGIENVLDECIREGFVAEGRDIEVRIPEIQTDHAQFAGQILEEVESACSGVLEDYELDTDINVGRENYAVLDELVIRPDEMTPGDDQEYHAPGDAPGSAPGDAPGEAPNVTYPYQCTHCDGHGIRHRAETCYHCGGSGKCQICGGSGVLPCDGDHSQGAENCPKCHGTGSSGCYSCEGSGKCGQETCDGGIMRWDEVCMTCGGDGWVDEADKDNE